MSQTQHRQQQQRQVKQLKIVVQQFQKKRKMLSLKEILSEKKEPVNIVFCGHVDVGKSTIGGQIM
jgi:GTPase